MERVSTWEELCAQLAKRQRAAVDAAPGRVELPGRIVLARLSVEGAPWVELLAIVGSARSLPITTTLRSNAATAVGAFCFVDGELALRQTLPLAGLRVVDLEWALKVLGWRVAETRKQLGLPVRS